MALLALLVLAMLSGCASTSAPTGGARASVATPRVVASAQTSAAAPALAPDRDVLPASAPTTAAASAFLFDPATGIVLYAKNAGAPVAMASTTKIVVALTALRFGTLDQPITVGADAVALENGISSVAGLRLGDTLTLKELLYCLLLPSGDDAAVAIADGIAGSQARFVGLMNLEAALMGLGHMHYNNVSGLDAPASADDNHTSAYQLAVLAAVAMRDATFRQIVGTSHIVLAATSTHRGYDLTNTNLLLNSQSYPGTIGIKTGFTGDAGGCLVFMVQRPYGNLLGVVLGEQVENQRFGDAVALLDWGFPIEQRLAIASQVEEQVGALLS